MGHLSTEPKAGAHYLLRLHLPRNELILILSRCLVFSSKLPAEDLIFWKIVLHASAQLVIIIEGVAGGQNLALLFGQNGQCGLFEVLLFRFLTA